MLWDGLPGAAAAEANLVVGVYRRLDFPGRGLHPLPARALARSLFSLLTQVNTKTPSLLTAQSLLCSKYRQG